MMHSSAAVSTPPSLSTPPALVHGRTSSRPRLVAIRPSPLRSTQVLYPNGALRWSPVGLGVPSALLRVPPVTTPIRVTEPWPPAPSARLESQVLPSLST